MIRQDCPEWNHKHGCNICGAWKKAFQNVWSVRHMSDVAEVCKFSKNTPKTVINATVPQQRALISLELKSMSTELDVLEQCSPRTGNRDREQGSWVWSGTRSLFLVLKVIIVYCALTGLSVTHEPIKTTCLCLWPRCLRAAPGSHRAECSLHAKTIFPNSLGWSNATSTHDIFSLSKQIWHDVYYSAVVNTEQWNFVFQKALS